MSAAERARLARAARAVLGLEAERGAARSGTLRRRIGDAQRPAAELRDVSQVPDWLPADAERRERLVIRAGVAAMSPVLAKTIDGAELRGLADRAGPELIDWALEIGARPDASSDGEVPDPARIEPVGRAVLAAALPERLAPWLGEPGDVAPAVAQWALDRSREAA